MQGNWTWGLSLIAVTMAVHAVGLAVMAAALTHVRDRLETPSHLGRRRLFTFFIVLISVVGLALAVLHGMEAILWAGAFWWVGALDQPSEAILYSVDSISTRGASGLTLEHRWRLMGALEATSGMLLFGISTAFLFAVMQAYWPFLTKHER